MKALFAHSLIFLEDENGMLYLRGYDNNYWDRYLKHFNTIYIIGRKKKVSNHETSGYSKFNRKGLYFVEVPEIHSLETLLSNSRKVNRIIDILISKVDYLIARLPGTYSTKAVKCCKKQGKPYLIEMVGCPWDALINHSLKGKIIAPYLTLSTKRTIWYAPYVIYVTNQFLQKRYPSKGRSIGCSDVALQTSDDGKVLKSRLLRIKNRSSNKPTILCTIGNISAKYKGHRYVIEAISLLNKEGYLFEYHIIGEGNNEYLKALAEELGIEKNLKFVGALQHNKIFQYIDDVDIYIQPSETEGLPRALIEAMSRACPAIGSNVGGIPELLEKQFMFRKRDVGSLVELLKRMNKGNMIYSAKKSYYMSQEYRQDVLDIRREVFYKDFINKRGLEL